MEKEMKQGLLLILDWEGGFIKKEKRKKTCLAGYPGEKRSIESQQNGMDQ